MKFNSLEELLVKELQDLYSAETQLVEALPKMQSAASSPELKEAIKKHLAETKQQVKRLETCLSNLQSDTKGETCEAMEGLIKEGSEMIKAQAPALVKDAALIGAAQRIEHYEIAGYGTAKAHAKLLNLDEIADLLDETLKEEAAADKKLTKIAEGTIFSSGINKQAAR
jgi:ferritin-like metal-binding protein YciE